MFLSSRLPPLSAFLVALLVGAGCASGSAKLSPPVSASRPAAAPLPSTSGTPLQELPLAAPKIGSRVIVLFVSDLHGQLRGDAVRGGGYARLATLFRQEREKAALSDHTDVLIVSGGDMAGKSAFPCRNSAEKECFPLLKEIGIDVAGLGNGELKRPAKDLNELLRLSEIAWTNGNVTTTKMASAWQPAYRYRGPRSGADWTILNWTVEPSPGEIDLKKAGYAVTQSPSPDWFARLAATPALKGRPILWVTHQTWDSDHRLLRGACATPGLGSLALLKAHTHEHLEDHGDCAPIFEPGPFGEWVSKLTFEFRPNESAAAEPRSSLAPRDWTLISHEFIKVDQGIAEEPRLKAKIEDLYHRLAPDADQVVGQVRADLTDAQAGQWLADTYRKDSHADVSVINLGAVKSGFRAGPLTREQLLTVIPYNNDIMGADIGWAEFSKALCKAAARARQASDDGGELIFSGARLVGAGTPDCRLETARRSRLKVVMDSYLMKNSARWLGIDFTGRAFKFGMNTEQAMLHGIQVEGGKL